MRVVVSFRLRLPETIRWTASTVHVPPPHTACITSFSRSVRGGRTRTPDAVRDVMVQYVPLKKVTVKKFLGFVGEGEEYCQLQSDENFASAVTATTNFVVSGCGPGSSPGWRSAFSSVALGLRHNGIPRWCGSPRPVRCSPQLPLGAETMWGLDHQGAPFRRSQRQMRQRTHGLRDCVQVYPPNYVHKLSPNMKLAILGYRRGRSRQTAPLKIHRTRPLWPRRSGEDSRQRAHFLKCAEPCVTSTPDRSSYIP